MARALTGANILLLVRDHIANDIGTMCREFGFDFPSMSGYYLMPRIEQLRQAGLIIDVGNGHYEVSAPGATAECKAPYGSRGGLQARYQAFDLFD